MKIVIIEDELPAVTALEKLLQEADSAISIVGTPDSVSSATAWFQKNPAPDLAFMDIQLGDGLSFDIFENTEVRCPVIFTTAYDEYAIRAFKLNSIDYLLKPISPVELAHSLQKFKRIQSQSTAEPRTIDLQSILKTIHQQHPTYKSRFLIPLKEQLLSIPVEEISYFFSEHKNTYLVTCEKKKHAIDYTLERLEEELNPRTFFRISRQYLVSYPEIAAVHSFFNGKLKIYLRGSNEEIIISRERAVSFKEWLDR